MNRKRRRCRRRLSDYFLRGNIYIHTRVTRGRIRAGGGYVIGETRRYPIVRVYINRTGKYYGTTIVTTVIMVIITIAKWSAAMEITTARVHAARASSSVADVSIIFRWQRDSSVFGRFRFIYKFLRSQNKIGKMPRFEGTLLKSHRFDKTPTSLHAYTGWGRRELLQVSRTHWSRGFSFSYASSANTIYYYYTGN